MPAKFDRSKYKATKVVELQDQQKEIEEKGYSGDGRAKVLRLVKDGSNNILRIAPKHENSKSWAFPIKTTFFKIQKKDKDGNLETNQDGTPKLGPKPVFNATIHGKTIDGNDFEKDLVDFYMAAVFRKANECQSKEERTKYLNHLLGYKKGKWISGIKPRLQYIVYGWLGGVFGRVELPHSVKKDLNTIAAQSDPESGAMAVDPFTDPDTGAGVVITYDKDEEENSKKYKTTINLAEVANPKPLSDAQMEQFVAQKSLQLLYEDVYTSRDFELALEGLERFDQESEKVLKEFGFEEGYRVFEDDQFLNEVEAFSLLVKDYEEAESEEGEDHSSESEEETEEEKSEYEVPTADEIDAMSKGDLREANDELDLQLKFVPTYKVDTMRNMVKEALGYEIPDQTPIAEKEVVAVEAPKKEESKDEAPATVEEVKEEAPVEKVVEEVEQQKEETPTAPVSLKDRLAAARKKANG